MERIGAPIWVRALLHNSRPAFSDRSAPLPQCRFRSYGTRGGVAAFLTRTSCNRHAATQSTQIDTSQFVRILLSHSRSRCCCCFCRLNSPRSRASRASTVSPCRQRTDPLTPSVQVSPGQQFHIEWSNGHSRSTNFFALLRAEHEYRLASVNKPLLEEYLREAPAGAVSNAEYAGPQWRKRHLGWASRQAKGNADSHADFLAEGKVNINNSKSDPEYLERPAAFCWSHLGQHKNSPDSNGNCYVVEDLTLYKYPTAAHAEDLHVAYSSAKHPWLLAVHRFRQTNSWPQQMDIAPFEVPSGSAPVC